jgi:hypothetical protein
MAARDGRIATRGIWDCVRSRYRVDAVTAPETEDGIAAKRIRLAELDAALVRLRAQYDQLMNAFKFDAARSVHTRIEAAERERAALAQTLPPEQAEPPPQPYTVARRRRRPPRKDR